MQQRMAHFSRPGSAYVINMNTTGANSEAKKVATLYVTIYWTKIHMVNTVVAVMYRTRGNPEVLFKEELLCSYSL